MKTFDEFVEKIENYLNNKNDYLNNKSFIEWFSNFISEHNTEEIEKIFNDAIDTKTRTATKEMLDFISIIIRNNNIRNKKIGDFFVDNLIRNNIIKYKLARKKIDLSDNIGYIND